MSADRKPVPPTAFESFAWLFAPATDPESCALLEADASWRFDPADLEGHRYAIWGRLATRLGPRGPLVISAVARERALRRVGRFSAGEWRAWDLYRIAQRSRRPGLRSVARFALTSGALVRLGVTPPGARVLDAVIAAAGRPAPKFNLRSSGDGSAQAHLTLPDGAPALLRLARVGGPHEPARNHQALGRLEEAGVKHVPRVVASGELLEVGWAAETIVPGQPVRGLSAALVADVVGWSASLPRHPTPPSAPSDRLGLIAEAMPHWRSELGWIGERLRPVIAAVPSVLEHGDLWAGNLLAENGRLTGVVDWDTWHPHGVPGSDLLQLLVAARRAETGLQLGELWLERPWSKPEFRDATSPYWAAMGVRFTDEVAYLSGVNWWAAHVARVLRHGRGLAQDPGWVARNVDNVVPELARRDAEAA